MNRALTRRLLLATLLSTAALAQAQMPPNADPRQAPPGHEGSRGTGKPLCHRGPPMDELSAVLGLQSTQREALSALLEQHHQARDRLHDDTRSKDQELAAQSDAQIAKVLSPAQMGKFRQWQQTHRPGAPPPGRGGPDDRRGSRIAGDDCGLPDGERRPPGRDGDRPDDEGAKP